MYFVWRRSDGYVDASNSTSRTSFNALSRAGGDTFELLLETEDWTIAFVRIVDERMAAGEVAGPVSDIDHENYALFKEILGSA